MKKKKNRINYKKLGCLFEAFLGALFLDTNNIDINSRIEQLKVEEPPVRQKGIMVSDVSELVQKLIHEAKVI